jgi:hypothetical protein
MLSLLAYVHVMSLALWFGGLFGYVVIVWPVILRAGAPVLPRSLLASIATRTALWIYLAMASALLSGFSYWYLGAAAIPRGAAAVYFSVLLALVANNMFGSLRSWPAIMLAPDAMAWSAWRAFYGRMAISMVLGLSCFSAGVLWISR